MPKVIALIVALLVFSGWLSVVGNPHVVETVIGLILAAVAGTWAYIELRKLKIFKRKPKA
tara:strand:+ start:141 stop:320 length:180 start_codon:yes stop_codon:yes gene_type:complete